MFKIIPSIKFASVVTFIFIATITALRSSLMIFLVSFNVRWFIIIISPILYYAIEFVKHEANSKPGLLSLDNRLKISLFFVTLLSFISLFFNDYIYFIINGFPFILIIFEYFFYILSPIACGSGYVFSTICGVIRTLHTSTINMAGTVAKMATNNPYYLPFFGAVGLGNNNTGTTQAQVAPVQPGPSQAIPTQAGPSQIGAPQPIQAGPSQARPSQAAPQPTQAGPSQPPRRAISPWRQLLPVRYGGIRHSEFTRRPFRDSIIESREKLVWTLSPETDAVKFANFPKPLPPLETFWFKGQTRVGMFIRYDPTKVIAYVGTDYSFVLENFLAGWEIDEIDRFMVAFVQPYVSATNDVFEDFMKYRQDFKHKPIFRANGIDLIRDGNARPYTPEETVVVNDVFTEVRVRWNNIDLVDADRRHNLRINILLSASNHVDPNNVYAREAIQNRLTDAYNSKKAFNQQVGIWNAMTRNGDILSLAQRRVRFNRSITSLSNASSL